MTDVTTPEEMREAAARIADAHEPQHEANATIANQVARNIAKAIRAIPIPQPDVAQAARVLLNNLPGEHDAWESLQNTVDDGCDVGDCMKAFLRALIGELK